MLLNTLLKEAAYNMVVVYILIGTGMTYYTITQNNPTYCRQRSRETQDPLKCYQGQES